MSSNSLEIISREATGQSKATVLFLHGAWHSASCWDSGFMERIAFNGYDCHAVSLRGHGRSASVGSLRWVRYRDYLDDLLSTIEDLGEVVLVGHSMGGYLIQKSLERISVKGVCLISPVPVTGTLKATWRFARRHPIQYAKVMAQARLWHVVASEELAGDVLLSDPDHPEAARVFDQLQDESFLAYLDMMFMALPKPARVVSKPPMLVMGGTEDRLFSASEFKNTARSWDAEVALFDGLPHDMMLVEGWESVADGLTEWLDRTLS